MKEGCGSAMAEYSAGIEKALSLFARHLTLETGSTQSTRKKLTGRPVAVIAELVRCQEILIIKRPHACSGLASFTFSQNSNNKAYVPSSTLYTGMLTCLPEHVF